MPPDSFSHTVAVAATPDDLWLALQDADTWEGIGPLDAVWDSSHDTEGTLTGYRWSVTAAGKRWEGTASRTALEPGRSLRLALDSSEITGAIEVSIEAAGSSRLTVTLEASPKGVLATMFWGIVRDALRSGLETHVDAFAQTYSPG